MFGKVGRDGIHPTTIYNAGIVSKLSFTWGMMQFTAPTPYLNTLTKTELLFGTPTPGTRQIPSIYTPAPGHRCDCNLLPPYRYTIDGL